MNSHAFLKVIRQAVLSLRPLVIRILTNMGQLKYSTVARKDHLLILFTLTAVIGFLAGRMVEKGPNVPVAVEQGAGTELVIVPAVMKDGVSELMLPVETNIAEIDRSADNISSDLFKNVGSLCARLAQLEALGEELMVLANMQDGEFDFQTLDCRENGTSATSPVPAGTGAAKKFDERVSLLNRQIDHIDYQLEIMQRIFTARRDTVMAQPFGVPLYGASSASITSRFGKRARTDRGGWKKSSFHKGLDLGAPYGSAVLAMGAGVVTFAGDNGDYGNLVEIDHGNGFLSRYGHNSENLVATGTFVRRGQMIARVGSSGRSTGPHVHVEVHSQGKAVDPLLILKLPRG